MINKSNWFFIGYNLEDQDYLYNVMGDSFKNYSFLGMVNFAPHFNTG